VHIWPAPVIFGQLLCIFGQLLLLTNSYFSAKIIIMLPIMFAHKLSTFQCIWSPAQRCSM